MKWPWSKKAKPEDQPLSAKERWCLLCDMHWADCSCPGPHDEEEEDDR